MLEAKVHCAFALALGFGLWGVQADATPYLIFYILRLRKSLLCALINIGKLIRLLALLNVTGRDCWDVGKWVDCFNSPTHFSFSSVGRCVWRRPQPVSIELLRLVGNVFLF